MKTVEVYQFAGSSCFPKKQESPPTLCELSSPVAEALDSGLKCFDRVSVKVISLGGLGCWSSTTTKEVSCCPLGATWLC